MEIKNQMLESLIPAALSIGAKWFGAEKDRDSQQQIAAQNIALQKEFAQNSISWKVEDAKRSGIHPLYALGAPTTSFSPVSIGSNMSETMGSIGQDISGAVSKMMSPEDKGNAFTRSAQALSLQKMGLENQLLASQIAKTKQDLLSPGIPTANQRYLVDGQGQTAISARSLPNVPGVLIKDEPLKRVSSAPEAPHQEPGAITDLGFARTATGFAPVPSKDVKERIEDMTIPEWTWAIRNQIAPTMSSRWYSPPPFDPGKGREWVFNTGLQVYESHPITRGRRPAYMTGRK